LAAQHSRPHLYELDLLRSVTALCVVGVHVAAFTIILTHTALGAEIQNGVVTALHFTREIFIAITGFVLVYTYGGKPFPVRKFWRKRGLGVFLPYVLWSLFYDWFSVPHTSWGFFAWRTFSDVLTGSASFQLYYILLTLEFYIILPWFLRFIGWARERPWKVFIGSFAVQLVILALDYRFIQGGPFSQTPTGQYLITYQSRFLPLYQFYMIFGGLAALYMNQVRSWVLAHGRLVAGLLVFGLALMWGNQVFQVNVMGNTQGYGITVFEPTMAVYGLVMSLFLYRVAYKWAINRAPAPPRASRFWLLISDVSFGIYLVHAYFLNKAMDIVVPVLPVALPEPVRVFLVWVFAAGTSVVLCVMLLYTPVLSRLIGRPHRPGLGRLMGELAQGWRTLQAEMKWRPAPERAHRASGDDSLGEPASSAQAKDRVW